ncbi:hypothetical protein V8F20_002944 [Naviculisporaceae sp. PSN 640]
MEPSSAAARIRDVISQIEPVTAAATTFMRHVRSARPEIIVAKKELAGLKAVLEMLADDFEDSTIAQSCYDDGVREPLVQVVMICQDIVNDVGKRVGLGEKWNGKESREAWATSGKAELEVLRMDLERARLLLSVELDSNTPVVIAWDYENEVSPVKAELPPIQEVSGPSKPPPPSSVIGYIRASLHRSWPTQSGVSKASVTTNNASRQSCGQLEPTTQTLEKKKWDPIIYTRHDGRRYTIPYELGRKWADMKHMIEESYRQTNFTHNLRAAAPWNPANHRYDLIGPGGNAILPDAWEALVKPGWKVQLKRWRNNGGYF